MRLYGLDNRVHLPGGLPHRKAPYAVAVQAHFRYTLHMLYAKVVIGAALVYAKEHLVRVQRALLSVEPCHLSLASFQPSGRAGAGHFCVFILGRVLHALVKGHGDGRAQIRLYAHTLLRAHKNLTAVYMGGEGNALLPDIPELC